MNEGLCSCVGEGWTEADNILKVNEGCLGDVLYTLVGGEG